MELAENIQKIKECIWTADLCRSTNCQKVQNFINDCQLKCFSQIEMIQMSHLNVSYDTSLPPSLPPSSSKFSRELFDQMHCDQICDFWNLGNFLKPLATITLA